MVFDPIHKSYEVRFCGIECLECAERQSMLVKYRRSLTVNTIINIVCKEHCWFFNHL